MTHPRLAKLLIVTLIASLISLGTPWISVATVGRIPVTATATVAVEALIVAFSTLIVALVAHRTRGLWVLLAAIPAFFWPVFAVSTVIACSIYDCD
jgi:hypothetical protein